MARFATLSDMGRIIKWALGIAGALILLVVAAVTVAVLVFDPEDYREDIELALTKATGREVTVGGELTMNLFPWLSIRTGDIEGKRFMVSSPPTVS